MANAVDVAYAQPTMGKSDAVRLSIARLSCIMTGCIFTGVVKKYVIIRQGSLEANPSVLIGSFLVGILTFRSFQWKLSYVVYFPIFSHVVTYLRA